MLDKDTGEELSFPLKRWLAREEDDREICRELPANRRGDPNLPGDLTIFSFISIFDCVSISLVYSTVFSFSLMWSHELLSLLDHSTHVHGFESRSSQHFTDLLNLT